MKCSSCGKEIVERSTSCPFCFSKVSPTGMAPGPPPPPPTGEDFGALFNRATNLWKDNLGDLVVFTLVFVLLGWIPIVNVAFFAGYLRGLMKLNRGGKA